MWEEGLTALSHQPTDRKHPETDFVQLELKPDDTLPIQQLPKIEGVRVRHYSVKHLGRRERSIRALQALYKNIFLSSQHSTMEKEWEI